MCKSSLHDLLVSLPKCEHHCHVEGTLMPATLFELARKNRVTLPDDPAYRSKEALLSRYRQFSNLDDFLSYYYKAMEVLVSKSDFEELAWAYFKRANADGVVHAEIFFDPQAHMDRISFADVVAGLSAGCKRAERELKMTTQLICCFLRHLPPSSALNLFDSKTFQECLSNNIVHGIGLDSSENDYPPELFIELYDKANALGLKTTAHAGEEGPPSNIQTSMKDLACLRIDHGIRLVEDKQLMKEVARRGSLLTVCPLSNLYLNNIPSISELPIRTFLAEGVKFSINSDDPAYLGGFILDNYCAVQEAFDLEVSDWNTICTSAIDGSWCSMNRKKDMLQMLKESIARHQLQ